MYLKTESIWVSPFPALGEGVNLASTLLLLRAAVGLIVTQLIGLMAQYKKKKATSFFYNIFHS